MKLCKSIESIGWAMRTAAFFNKLYIGSFITLLLLASASINTVAQETAVLQWANHVGGTQGDVFRDIARDPSGNIITIGKFNQTADFDPSSGTFNITAPNGGGYTMKMDANGNLVWAKSFQGELGIGGIDMFALAIDNDGNSYITGDFFGTVDFDPGPNVFNMVSAGHDDTFFAKLDASGNLVWAKALPSVGAYAQSKQIAVDANANIYLTGTVLNTTDFDPGPGETLVTGVANQIQVYFAKYNANGELLWVKTIRYPVGALTQSGPGADAMVLDAAGNIYIGGAFSGTSDFDPGPGIFNMTAFTGPFYTNDAYIMKLDNSGNFLWAKSYTGEFGEGVASIKTDGTHVYVVGEYGGNAMDFDPGAGETLLSGSKLYVSKFDVNGNFVWARTMGGLYVMQPWLALDAGNVYITSSFATSIGGPADYDPGAGEYFLNAPVWDVALTKLTKDGNFVWAASFGSADDFDVRAKPVIDPAGNIYVSGEFSRTSDFDPSGCTYNVTSYGQTDAFNFKVSQQAPVSPPVITSFSPASGSIGTTVVITGTNFSTTPASNTVKFANNRTAIVTASTATSLTVTIPASTVTGKITVTTNCQTATSANDFTVTAAQPEINIKQNTTNIPSTGSYAFGNQPISTSSAAVTFTIENTGTSVLNLSGNPKVAIAGANASEFTVNQTATTATVAAAGTTTFTITFSPATAASKTAQLSIANSDGNENPYLINLTGTGVSCTNPAKPTITQTSSSDFTSSTLTSSPAPAGGTYQWFNDGVAIDNATLQSYTTSVVGAYTVRITVAGGCSATSDPFVIVVTAIEPPNTNDFALYPNPVKGDWLTLSLGQWNGKKDIAVYQTNSKQLLTLETLGNEANLYVGEYPAGMYIVRVSTSNSVGVLKFIKQ
jgi:hypothetical protein